MKRNRKVELNDEEWIIVDKLFKNKRRSGLLRLVSPDASDDGVAAISSLKNYSAIPYLVRIMLCGDMELREAASVKVAELLSVLPVKSWPWLEESIRSYDYLYSNSALAYGWYSVQKEDVLTLINSSQHEPEMAAVLSCHSNGHVRDAALGSLMTLHGPLVMPVLLMRANDWVPNVRSTAYAGIWARINGCDAETITQNIYLLSRLRVQNRKDHNAILSAIDEKLTSLSVIQTLLSLISSSDFLIAREALAICERMDVDKLMLAEVAGISKDIVIRSKSINFAVVSLSADALFSYLENCLQDKALLIRKKALYLLVEHYPDGMQKLLMKSIFDKKYGLRQTARFYLEKLYGIDPRSLYLYALTEGVNDLSVSVMGLSECGLSIDWSLVSSFADSQSAAVQTSVMIAGLEMSPNDGLALIERALVSGCPVVAAAASKGLCKAANIEPAKMMEMYEQATSPLHFKIMRKLITRYDKWDGLILILSALNMPDEENVSDLLVELNAWVEKYYRGYWFVSPDVTQMSKLKVCMEPLRFVISNKALYRCLNDLVAMSSR